MKAFAERECSKRIASVRVKFHRNVMFILISFSFTLNQVASSIWYLSKFLSSFHVVLEVSLILGYLVLGCL